MKTYAVTHYWKLTRRRIPDVYSSIFQNNERISVRGRLNYSAEDAGIYPGFPPNRIERI
jgi:hypothetical protein